MLRAFHSVRVERGVQNATSANQSGSVRPTELMLGVLMGTQRNAGQTSSFRITDGPV